MTCPGDLDVIAGGASGMGPCPPSQHQPPGAAEILKHNLKILYLIQNENNFFSRKNCAT
jgi:hypothetical protein